MTELAETVTCSHCSAEFSLPASGCPNCGYRFAQSHTVATEDEPAKPVDEFALRLMPKGHVHSYGEPVVVLDKTYRHETRECGCGFFIVRSVRIEAPQKPKTYLESEVKHA